MPRLPALDHVADRDRRLRVVGPARPDKHAPVLAEHAVVPARRAGGVCRPLAVEVAGASGSSAAKERGAATASRRHHAEGEAPAHLNPVDLIGSCPVRPRGSSQQFHALRSKIERLRPHPCGFLVRHEAGALVVQRHRHGRDARGPRGRRRPSARPRRRRGRGVHLNPVEVLGSWPLVRYRGRYQWFHILRSELDRLRHHPLRASWCGTKRATGLVGQRRRRHQRHAQRRDVTPEHAAARLAGRVGSRARPARSPSLVTKGSSAVQRAGARMRTHSVARGTRRARPAPPARRVA